MVYTTGKFAVDEIQFIQFIPVRILVAVARDELDLNLLAREELANRGYDEQGIWVGPRRARAEFNAWRSGKSARLHGRKRKE